VIRSAWDFLEWYDPIRQPHAFVKEGDEKCGGHCPPPMMLIVWFVADMGDLADEGKEDTYGHEL
jgi:hypothetical protein